jgi:hypothetical protein
VFSNGYLRQELNASKIFFPVVVQNKMEIHKGYYWLSGEIRLLICATINYKETNADTCVLNFQRSNGRLQSCLLRLAIIILCVSNIHTASRENDNGIIEVHNSGLIDVIILTRLLQCSYCLIFLRGQCSFKIYIILMARP